MFDIQEELKKLPEKPGVYLMKDIHENIIYVGKAVILKNRVRQYFQANSNQSAKVVAMVAQIDSFEYIITDSELEALILECNLIKQYRPKFNVLLKDDKTYPYIKITIQEDFPRILIVRKKEKDGAKYFGPYTSYSAIKNVMEIIKKYFPTKKCKKQISENYKGKGCLNFHIGNCLAPCEGNIAKQEYRKMIDSICDFLSGDKKNFIKYLESLMQEEASKLNFEKAVQIRDALNGLKYLSQEQKATLDSIKDRDIIGLAKNETDACIQVFFIREGKLVGREHFIMADISGETEEGLVEAFIKQFYINVPFVPREILLPTRIANLEIFQQWFINVRNIKVNIKVPQRGEASKLVSLVNKNAQQELDRFVYKKSNFQVNGDKVLDEIRNLLSLDDVPNKIEAYDVSNTGNDDIVVSMVVFIDGKADKSKYRRFKINSINIQNDYGAMQEAIYRRFTHKGDKDESFSILPNLILVDGGKGHVSAVSEVLSQLNISEDIALAGMVKDDKHRTRGLIVGNKEYDLQNKFILLRFITSIQDEAHRFAITYNKKLRKMRYQKSSLDEIYGIGEVKKKNLIKYFGSVTDIKKASLDELIKVDGIDPKLAKNIYEYYRKNKS